MNLKKFVLALIVVLFLIPTGVLLGGTVFLKNGHVVTGKIIANDEDKVVVTWGNGRATIYRRFVDNVVLDSSEMEYLARRTQAQTVGAPASVNDDIELPDLDQLIQLRRTDEDLVVDVEAVSDSDTSDVTPELDSTSSAVTLLKSEVPPTLPSFSRVELEGLGVSVDVPSGWTSVNATNAGRITSEDGSVMIALDRYPQSDLAPEEAAVTLGDRLESAGFQSKASERSSLFSALHPAFISESLSPSGNQDCLHGLVTGEDGILLVSVYTPHETSSDVDGLIASVLTSLKIPVASQ
ncbi:MAG: hypothetical protein VX764_05355 [Planctomycetota bacterium]|nr:hypothetical protein [Planctomycetota bacterium]